MTTRLPERLWSAREGFRTLTALLGEAQGEVRIVGGAVRDWLLDIDVNDIDLATQLSPQEVTDRLTSAGLKVVPTGIEHGTVTAVIDHKPVEITTLRRDVSTDGRRATIAYTQDWHEDAARRDFTINALYVDPVTGEIFDYFGGIEDLKQGRVRFIGGASQRIAEDHLRILRYFRFLARFGALPPDEAAYRACIESANSLMALSRERIADELLKTLALPNPAAVLRLMLDGGILRPVIPEIDEAGIGRLAVLLEREKEAAIICPDALLRFAALLPRDTQTGEHVAARLKLSNKARKRISALLTPPPAHNGWRELAYRLGKDIAMDQVALRPALPIDWHTQIAGWQAPSFPLGGRDLLERGIRPGPDVAKILQQLTEYWIADNFPPREEVQKMADQLVAEFREASQ